MNFVVDLGPLTLGMSYGAWELRDVRYSSGELVAATVTASNPQFTMLEVGQLRMTLPKLAVTCARLAKEVVLKDIASDIWRQYESFFTKVESAVVTFIEEHNLSDKVDDALRTAKSLGKQALTAAEAFYRQVGAPLITVEMLVLTTWLCWCCVYTPDRCRQDSRHRQRS